MFLQNLQCSVTVNNYKRFCIVKENKCLRRAVLTSDEKRQTDFELWLVLKKKKI